MGSSKRLSRRNQPASLRWIVIAAVCFLPAAWSSGNAAAIDGDAAAVLVGRVIEVTDGDTIHVALASGPVIVRLHSIDTPERAQPWGRQAWASAPTAADLERVSPTRDAVDRALGPRRTERTLTLATAWPAGRERDLAWANLATFAGRRNANGYDPMVPASRRTAFDGMGVDGVLPRSFLDTDPGRLELLGVRWVQVPTSALVVPPDAAFLGEPLDVAVEPPRPHLFSLPITRATEVRILSFLAGAVEVEQGRVVAECVVRLASGREIWLPIRAGVETAEWAWERPDVRAAVRHGKAAVHTSFPAREGFTGHQYLAVLPLPGRFAVASLRFRAWPGAPPLWLLRAGLRDAASGRGAGLSAAELPALCRVFSRHRSQESVLPLRY